MQENRNDSELGLVVTSTRRDGRRRYDSQSKRRLAQACLQPGVSLAGMGVSSFSVQ
jgi:transposase